MSSKQLRLTNERLKFQGRINKKNLFLGTLVALAISATPFYFELYKSVPHTKVWDTFLFTYESPYYETVFVLAWTLTNKLVPLFLFFIWFFTNRHWWFHAIIIPIAMYIYQIIVVLDDDLQFADTNHIIYLLPVMAVVIPSIYLIRAKMFNKINEADKTLEDLEEEFMIKPKSFLEKLSNYF